MADGVAITPGSGTTIATDDVAGVHYQRVKLVDGTLDASTAIAAGGGVETGALRVTIASNSTGLVSVDDNGGSLTVDGTVAVSTNAELGIVTEAAPATDTASSGLNGRLQRIAQRLTSLIALLPPALGAGGGVKVDGSGTALPISAASLPLPTGAALDATVAAQSAKLPATLGQKAMAAAFAVSIASDQSAVPVLQAGMTSVTATPTLDTSAYASGDCLHTAVIEFADAVPAGGSAYVEKMVVVDAAVQSQPCELWLFASTVTPAAANAAHSISDADAVKCVGIISSGAWYASALNSVSVARGVNLAVKLTGTSLFGILVTRGTPTYAATSLTVSLLLSRNAA